MEQDAAVGMWMLLAEGHAAAAIGRRLGIAAATVSKHQENLYRKLRTRDRLTTVLTAQGLAQIDETDVDGRGRTIT